MSLSSEHADFNPLFVFPCYGKKPAFGFKWQQKSTNIPVEIARLKRDYPTAVWAINIGKSGLICIDCDKDGDNEGIIWLQARCPDPKYLNTVPGCWTPSSGRHFYFKNPKGLGCSRGKLPNKDVCNIDVKGDGGYCLRPGEDTTSSGGGRYVPIGDLADAPDLPEWLEQILIGPERHPARDNVPPVELPPLEGAELARCLAYGKALLDGACRDVALATEGTRNQTANDCSLRVGHFVGGGCIGHSEALDALQAAVRVCHLAGDPDLPKALRTVERALLDGTREPKRPPPETDAPGVVLNFPRAREDGLGPEAEPARSRWLWHGDEDVEAVHAWLVDKLLPETGIVILAGQPKKGKSIIALDICGSIMAAPVFLDYKITRPGGVLFLALPTEGVKEVPIRLRALVKDKLADQGLPEGFLDRLPIAWLRDGENAFNLQKQSDVDRLAVALKEAVAKMQDVYGVPVVLIVIDTMEAAAKFSNGYPANEAKRVVETLAAISQSLKVCILVIDHLGKDEDQGPLGSIAKEGGADVVLSVRGKTFAVHSSRLTKSGAETARQFTLKTVKLDDDGNESFTVHWKPKKKLEELAGDEDAHVIDPLVAAGKAKQAAIDRWPKHLRVFRRVMKKAMQIDGERHPVHGRPMVRLETVREQFQKDRLGDDDKEVVRKAFRRALDGVDAEGLVLKFNIDENEYLYFMHTDDEK